MRTSTFPLEAAVSNASGGRKRPEGPILQSPQSGWVHFRRRTADWGKRQDLSGCGVRCSCERCDKAEPGVPARMPAVFQDRPMGGRIPGEHPLCNYTALMIASTSGGRNSRVTAWAAAVIRTGTIGQTDRKPYRVKSLRKENCSINTSSQFRARPSGPGGVLPPPSLPAGPCRL